MLEYETANPGQDSDQKEQAQHGRPETSHEKHEQHGIEATDFTGARWNTQAMNSGIIGGPKEARKAKQGKDRSSYEAGPSSESGPASGT